MKKTLALSTLILCFPSFSWASKYESPLEAFVVGAGSWLVFIALIFIVRWIIRLTKKVNNMSNNDSETSEYQMTRDANLSKIKETGNEYSEKQHIAQENKSHEQNNDKNENVGNVEKNVKANGDNSKSTSVQDIDINNVSWEEIYHRLFVTQKEELNNKCNPKNFMNPYDHDKVEMANNFLIELKDAHNYNDIKKIRTKAKKLGVSISLEQLFNYLSNICNPINYIGKENFVIANNLFSKIISSKENLEELEEILEEAQKSIKIQGEQTSKQPHNFVKQNDTAERNYELSNNTKYQNVESPQQIITEDEDIIEEDEKDYNYIYTLLFAFICIGTIALFFYNDYMHKKEAYEIKDTTYKISETYEPTESAPRKVYEMQYTTPIGECKYSGYVNEQNMPDGDGEAYFDDGRYYKGGFVNGNLSGENAYFKYPNGDEFRGTFNDNKFEQGTYRIAEDGSYYVGTFKNGQPDEGTWYDKNGDIIQ